MHTSALNSGHFVRKISVQGISCSLKTETKPNQEKIFNRSVLLSAYFHIHNSKFPTL